jgi:sterol desaturase/sphingolipid hydroxylase (fatty acid hydroxylase superfamily)
VIVLWAVLGAIGWTLVEYFLHRYGAHEKPNKLSFRTHHLQHHSRGNWFAPWTEKARTALPVVVILALASGAVVGPANGAAFTLAFSAMYVSYEIVHRRIHTHPPIGWYSALIRRHHLHHHFRNPKANHGVTSPVWDHVFGTAETTELVRIPRKLAPFWLTDDRHVGFELRGKAR